MKSKKTLEFSKIYSKYLRYNISKTETIVNNGWLLIEDVLSQELAEKITYYALNKVRPQCRPGLENEEFPISGSKISSNLEMYRVFQSLLVNFGLTLGKISTIYDYSEKAIINDLLKYAFPKLIKQNSGRLPVNKYLSCAKGDYPECEAVSSEQNFDFIISKSIKNNRKCLGSYTSIKQIWDNENDSLEKATRLMSHLTEEMIDVDELGLFLKSLFDKDINVLNNSSSSVRTNIRRLIAVYDYLKWGKVKELSD